MSNLILDIIPKQTFEVIRDRIGVVLALEYGAQQRMRTDIDKADVYVERYVGFNHTELPAINIVFPRGIYDRQDVKTVEGTFTFFIECYAAAKSTVGENADSKAMLKVQRMLGICRAILENPKYIRLSLTAGLIGRCTVTNIELPDPNAMDATSSVVGRLTYEVRAQSDTQLSEGVEFEGVDTEVTLSDTEDGYKYTYNA